MGSFHCILLLRQCLCIEFLARLGAHGHVVLCEGADPGTVGGVQEDDVGGAEVRAGGASMAAFRAARFITFVPHGRQPALSAM